MSAVTKKCSKCGQVKPITEFHKNKSKKDGLKSWCKACVNEANRQWKAANPDKVREMSRQYRAANPDKVRERDRQYRATHKAEQSAYYRQRRLAYPERVAARNAVTCAIRSGKLAPASTQTCAHCGGQAAEYHHDSYAVENRLKVIPLCRSCHKRHHAELKRQAARQAAVSQHQPDQAADQADQGTALSDQQAVSQEADQGQPVFEPLAFDLTPFIQLELQLEA